MNVAVIFSGGVGKRMGSDPVPKQFLRLHGRPILLYTLDIFQRHRDIDEIVLVMLENWIEKTEELMAEYNVTKVRVVIPGGKTGQESIWKGVEKARELYPDGTLLLIHDGVRPLIDPKVISANIEKARKNGMPSLPLQ